jgi:murein DD-endopeptidase MepM/ murein hydrolase activator NlpD
VFFAGFATGLIFLAGLLEVTGNLHRVTAPVAAQASAVDAGGPSSPPPANEGAPPGSPFLPVAPPLEAERPKLQDVPNPDLTRRGLIIPVQNVEASALRDNFDEGRNGHRHEAIDIMAPRGTAVLAADEGNVVKLFTSKPGGLTVYQFDDSRTYCYYYAHLDHYAAGLREGMLLRKGDVLGYVGSTGDASAEAPHLHFTIFRLGPEKKWWQGKAINPYGILTARPY